MAHTRMDTKAKCLPQQVSNTSLFSCVARSWQLGGGNWHARCGRMGFWAKAWALGTEHNGSAVPTKFVEGYDSATGWDLYSSIDAVHHQNPFNASTHPTQHSKNWCIHKRLLPTFTTVCMDLCDTHLEWAPNCKSIDQGCRIYCWCNKQAQ